MGKSGGKNTNNLLRISGILFLAVGAFHTARFLLKSQLFSVQLTYTGSLIVGVCLLFLAYGCFMESRR